VAILVANGTYKIPSVDGIAVEPGLLTGLFFAIATALGFALALVLFAGMREQLAMAKVPKAMQGTPIALLTAGLLAMAFMGFSGVV
jgi:electron transport complex protein RnfA